MYTEKREPHADACECDHCIMDRRHEEWERRSARGLEMAEESNRLLSAILDELRALRSESNR